ncbi:U-box domain-containing protein 3 [Sesamum angolense]|uniref:RING-type E3 ubiquitin transferase n=1 Tax=Sesamum angolense TaxID=2727404 RepID=A0AAE1XAS0_9LAMI|nr:U-box domain-containing protein 3 [Sesamum angolense]
MLRNVSCKFIHITIDSSRTVLDDVADHKSPLNEALSKECKKLDVAVNEAREFLEKWSPRKSKILCVLQSKDIVVKVSLLHLRQLFITYFHSNFLHMKESQNLKLGELSGCIGEILEIQKEGRIPDDGRLMLIVESLNLRLKQELLTRNGLQIPPYFRCPLSLELMLDPVIVASGQTYERTAIRKWLDHGLVTCPKTDDLQYPLQLRSSTSIPSLEDGHGFETLYVDVSPRLNEEGFVFSGKNVISHPLNFRKHYNSSKTMAEMVKNGSRRPSRTLSSPSELGSTNLASTSDVGRLIKYLKSASNVELIQEHAVTALLNLSINEKIKARIGAEGAVEPLIHVLRTGNAVARANAAAALFSLSLLDEYRIKIGRSGAVKPLVDLLQSVQAGAIKYLVRLMGPASEMVDKAVALLANLSTITEGCSAIAREGGIPLLVEIVETGSQRGKENAASILLQLCINSPKYCRTILQEGVVPPLVALSLSGTPRAKEKAQQLLSHFRSQRKSAVATRRS